MTERERRNPLLRGVGYGFLFVIPIWAVIGIVAHVAVQAL